MINVAQVSAQDPDLAAGGELTFTWDETGNEENALFKRYLEMDENTGIISLKRIPGTHQTMLC